MRFAISPSMSPLRAAGAALALMGSRGGVLVGLLISLLVVPPIAAAGRDQSVEALCGASDTNLPIGVVQLTSGRDIWVEFPAMRRAPRLEVDDQPATIVVFHGDYDLGRLAPHLASSASADLGTVVCVVQGDGSVSLFTDVPTQGSRFGP